MPNVLPVQSTILADFYSTTTDYGTTYSNLTATTHCQSTIQSHLYGIYLYDTAVAVEK